nr:putative silk protein 3 [Ephestia kuehniella]
MIPKILRLFVCISWLQSVYGAAYSKVYVQSGSDFVPVEYVKYGAPRVVTNAQIAELSAPPIGSAVPLPNVLAPCVAPCIVPAQAMQAVPSNAKIISYNAPSVPAVVVPSNDDKSSYEYSYVVYDEETGDRKAQRELSDGSVVQGEYSFVQPDGYIREVKYTADDLTGFNAVVKSFLPESVPGNDKKSPEIKNKSEPPPCKETKSEAIKVETENLEPSHQETSAPISESLDSKAHDELEVLPVSPEPVTAQSLVPADIYVGAVGYKPDSNKYETKPEYDSVTRSEHFLIHINETQEEHAKHGEHPPEIAVNTVVHKNQSPEYVEDISHDQNITTPPSAAELIKVPNKEDCSDQTHESVLALTPQAPAHQVPTLNGLSAYNDIIKCVQAALANKDGNAPNISPLTYIILPAGNKPC